MPATCPRRGGMLAIYEPGWNPVPGTCPRRGGMLAICGRAGTRCQAPVQGRGGMLAIYGPQEIGARHLSKDAAGC